MYQQDTAATSQYGRVLSMHTPFSIHLLNAKYLVGPNDDSQMLPR